MNTDPNIGIIACGAYVGEYLEKNTQLVSTVSNFDTNKANCSLESWIEKHYGIRSRAKTTLNCAEMAYKACLNALNKSVLDITDIDFLILNTSTGDNRQPTTATAVQQMLGMKSDSFAIELNMPCAGNIFGLSIGKNFIKSSSSSIGLVVGVDKMSSIIDPTDFIMAAMFGDGAGAALIGENATYTIASEMLQSKGDPNGALQLNRENSPFLLMHGAHTSDFISTTISSTIKSLNNNSSLDCGEPSLQIIPHQASQELLIRSLTSLGYSKRQISFTNTLWGNTSSGSILITLSEYLEQEHIAKNIYLIGMGGGLNWGGMHLTNRTPS